eukprot:scaffold1718_cov363-Prasinococcus_capsulatus_cf.AAC.5
MFGDVTDVEWRMVVCHSHCCAHVGADAGNVAGRKAGSVRGDRAEAYTRGDGVRRSSVLRLQQVWPARPGRAGQRRPIRGVQAGAQVWRGQARASGRLRRGALCCPEQLRVRAFCARAVAPREGCLPNPRADLCAGADMAACRCPAESLRHGATPCTGNWAMVTTASTLCTPAK